MTLSFPARSGVGSAALSATLVPIKPPAPLEPCGMRLACHARAEGRMEKCDGCGNEYEKPFEVTVNGRRYVFDSFECAVDPVSPRC